MKKVYRHQDNRGYWDNRWAEAGNDPDRFSNLTIYPIKYAERVMTSKSDRCLEIGAGLGRVLKHYHYQGFDVTAIERSEIAVEKLKEENDALKIAAEDVCHMPYEDGAYDVIMAFGVYHNIEDQFDESLAETARCLAERGAFCISMRPNNIEMKLNERYWNWKQQPSKDATKQFHKWLVTEREFREILASHGLQTTEVHRARNMSILYRIPFLRARSRKESERRGQGYRLNLVGRLLDGILTKLMPSQFCNVLVFIGTKQTGAPASGHKSTPSRRREAA